MNLSEFGVIHNNFVTELIKELPKFTKTLTIMIELKRQRKLRNWNPAEGIEDEASMQEIDTSLGATEQGF